MAQKTVRDANPSEADQNVKEEQKKGGILSDKAQRVIQQMKRISADDMQFLKHLKKGDGGKLMYVDQNGERALTDDEKMRAAELLIAIVLLMMKSFLKEMSKEEFDKKKKQLEDKHLKNKAPGDLSDVTRLINSIVKSVN